MKESLFDGSMKYFRKIIWLVIAVAFVASIIIGIGIIYSLKNVNVTLKSYAYSGITEEEQLGAADEIDDIKEIVFDKYGGKLISNVSEQGLVECFTGTDYILESFEKVPPCTLNITVKERRETFVVAENDGTYSTYDGFGTLMRSGAGAEAINNAVDGAPNLYVSGTDSAEDVAKVTDIAGMFANKFSSLRSIVKLIYLNSRGGSLIFKLHCGVEICITEYTSFTETKIQVAYDEYLALSGEEKLSGYIMAGVDADKAVVAKRYEGSLVKSFIGDISKDFPDIVL